MINDITNDLPSNGEYRQRNLSDIKRIIVHHSASKSGQFTPYDFAKWHIDPNGRLKSPRIAYHFCIEPDGKIYQVNKLTAISWHCINANFDGIGIELNGNFDIEEPILEEIQSLKWLIRYLRKHLNFDLQVFGHKEIQGNVTACPGKNFIIDDVRLIGDWKQSQ